MSGLGQDSLLLTLIVGGIAGWLAGLVMRGSGYGIIGDVILGLLGAVAGGVLLDAIRWHPHLGSPLLDKGVVAFLGAVLLLFIVGLLRPRTVGERMGDWWRRR